MRDIRLLARVWCVPLVMALASSMGGCAASRLISSHAHPTTLAKVEENLVSAHTRGCESPSDATWQSTTRVSLVPCRTCACYTDSSLAEQLQQLLRGWSIAQRFSELLAEQLTEKAPFEVRSIEGANMGEPDWKPDSSIGLGLCLLVRDAGPEISLICLWTVTPTDPQVSMTSEAQPTSGESPPQGNPLEGVREQDAKDFLPLGVSRAKAPREKRRVDVTKERPEVVRVAGSNKVTAERHTVEEWLGQDGQLARDQIEQVMQKLAQDAASDMLTPKSGHPDVSKEGAAEQEGDAQKPGSASPAP